MQRNVNLKSLRVDSKHRAGPKRSPLSLLMRDAMVHSPSPHPPEAGQPVSNAERAPAAKTEATPPVTPKARIKIDSTMTPNDIIETLIVSLNRHSRLHELWLKTIVDYTDEYRGNDPAETLSSLANVQTAIEELTGAVTYFTEILKAAHELEETLLFLSESDDKSDQEAAEQRKESIAQSIRARLSDEIRLVRNNRKQREQRIQLLGEFVDDDPDSPPLDEQPRTDWRYAEEYRDDGNDELDNDSIFSELDGMPDLPARHRR